MVLLDKRTKIKEKEFIKGVLFIDNQGKFSFIISDEKSKKYDEIIQRQQTITSSIEEQNKLTPELKDKIKTEIMFNHNYTSF